MMGKDCERILSTIISIEDSISDSIMKLSEILNTPVIIKADHNHGEEGSITKFEFKEKEDEIDISDLISEIDGSISGFNKDMKILSSLEEGLYTDKTSFNNSNGSPWSEIHRMEKSIKQLKNLVSPGKYNGGKTGLIALMSVALASCIDAKWALIMYNDYIQRGFDAKENDKKPSITHKGSDKKETIGNIKQDFDENVNIPKESLDPF